MRTSVHRGFCLETKQQRPHRRKTGKESRLNGVGNDQAIAPRLFVLYLIYFLLVSCLIHVTHGEHTIAFMEGSKQMFDLVYENCPS